MYCPKCGKYILVNALFCYNCGTKIPDKNGQPDQQNCDITQKDDINESATYEGSQYSDLSGIEFENLCYSLLQKMGFEVKKTKVSGDGGIDLIAWEYDPIRKGKYIIQCKRYVGSIGEPIIRDLYGVVMSERANKGILITTGRFTTSAYRFAVDKQIELIDGKALDQIIDSYGLTTPKKNNTPANLRTVLNNWFEYDILEEMIANNLVSFPQYSYYIERLYDLFIYSYDSVYGINLSRSDRSYILDKTKKSIQQYKNLKSKDDHHFIASKLVYTMTEAMIATYEGDFCTAIEKTQQFLSSQIVVEEIKGTSGGFTADTRICYAIQNIICLFNILGMYEKSKVVFNKYIHFLKCMVVVNNDYQDVTFLSDPTQYLYYHVQVFNAYILFLRFGLKNFNVKPCIEDCEYNKCTWEYVYKDQTGKTHSKWLFLPHSLDLVRHAKVECNKYYIVFDGFATIDTDILIQQKARARLIQI